MNQYDPYSMTTDEKRRQLMEMYNLQFNPQPMQPPKPPRMAALPAGATMATPPAIAFARGPSQLPRQQQAQEMPMGGGMGQQLREAAEQKIDKIYPYKLSELPDTGKVNDMILAALKPSYGDSAQDNYNAYSESLKRYERIRPLLENISEFYTSLVASSKSAIEKEIKLPFDQVFSEYIRQIYDVPDDLYKSFFDWYAKFISGRASAETGLSNFHKKKKEQMAMSQYQAYSQWANRTGRPVASIEEFVRNYDRIAEGAMDQSRRIPLWMLNIRSQPPFINPRTGDSGIPATGRQAPIRPPYKESAK